NRKYWSPLDKAHGYRIGRTDIPGGVGTEGAPVGQVHDETDIVAECEPAAYLLFIGVKTGKYVPGTTTVFIAGRAHQDELPIDNLRLSAVRNSVQVFDSGFSPNCGDHLRLRFGSITDNSHPLASIDSTCRAHAQKTPAIRDPVPDRAIHRP